MAELCSLVKKTDYRGSIIKVQASKQEAGISDGGGLFDVMSSQRLELQTPMCWRIDIRQEAHQDLPLLSLESLLAWTTHP